MEWSGLRLMGSKGFLIKSIEEADLAQPRFVWVDEDGHQVSPVHTTFRRALNFISGWQGNFDRIKGLEEQTGHILPASKQLTKTGKPPVALKRVVITATVEDLTEDEQRLVAVMRG